MPIYVEKIRNMRTLWNMQKNAAGKHVKYAAIAYSRKTDMPK